MPKKILLSILVITIFSLMSFSTFAEGESPSSDVVDDTVKALTIEASDTQPVTSTNVSEEPLTTTSTTEVSPSSNVSTETSIEPIISSTPKPVTTSETSQEPAISGEPTQDPNKIDDVVVDKNLKTLIEKVIKAHAQKYNITEEEAAEFINMLLEEAKADDSLNFKVSKDGSLVFSYAVIVEIKYDGTFLVNGEAIIGNVAELYDIPEEDVYEFMLEYMALYEETIGEFTEYEKEITEDGIKLKFESVLEIKNDGTIVIDGEIIPPEEIEEPVGSDKENPIEVVAVDKGVLPKTGESNPMIFVFIGMGIVLLGVGTFIIRKKKLASN